MRSTVSVRRTGAALASVVSVLVMCAPWWAEGYAAESSGTPWDPDSGVWGTDLLGRDVLGRTLAGGGELVGTALVAGCLTTSLGIAAAIAAATSSRARAVVLRSSALFMAVPAILVTLLAAVTLPPAVAVVVAMAVVATPHSARLLYAGLQDVLGSGFLLAASARGESRTWIVLHEAVPAMSRTALADLTLRVITGFQLGSALWLLTAASVGPNWAVMVRENLPGVALNPAAVLAPAAALAASCLVAVAGLELLPRPTGVRAARRSTIPASPEASGTAAGPPPDSIAALDNLTVLDGRGTMVLDRTDIAVRRGEVLGIVGPSGSGKSTLLTLLAGARPAGLVVAGGTLRWNGRPVPVAGGRAGRSVERRRLRYIGYLGQDPAAALDPLDRVGAVVRRTARERGVNADAVWKLCDSLGTGRAFSARRCGSLSGGQAQRLACVRAMAGGPELLLLDEPTSALDSENVDRLSVLVREYVQNGGSCVVVSHDLEFTTALCDRVLLLDRGRLASRPAPSPVARVRSGQPTVVGLPTLTVEDLVIRRPGRAPLGPFTFAACSGELVVLSAPSGRGKSSVLSALAGITPAGGSVHFSNRPLPLLDPVRAVGPIPRADRDPRWYRTIGWTGQFPATDLNPARRLSAAVARPAVLAGTADPRGDALRILDTLTAPTTLGSRFPDECSGGQRQRAALARTLAGRPGLLLLDEPTSALDSAAAELVLDELDRYRAEHGAVVLVASHDSRVLQRADRTVRWDGDVDHENFREHADVVR